MRRLALASLLALVLVAPASASEHLMTVSEVRPAGDPFVELRDPVPEPFPGTAYKVTAYGANGAPLGSQTFPEPEPFRNDTQPYTLGAGADAPLTVPVGDSRKVCFERSDGSQIHCLSFGAVPAGQSAQLQSCGKAGFATPTKDAANAVVPAACSGGGGSGGGGGGGSGGGGDDHSKPVAKLGGKRAQKLSKLALTVSVDEASTVVVTGSAKAGGRKRKVRKATRKLAKAGKVTVKVKFAKKSRRAVKAALSAGKKPVVKLKATITDRAGNRSVKRRSIKLKS